MLQVVTTIDRLASAESLARSLVAANLAACVQIVGPIKSVYRWQGKIESAEEWQCWIKTRRELYPRLEEEIRRLHAYDVPEIVAVAAEAVSAPYLRWLHASVD